MKTTTGWKSLALTLDDRQLAHWVRFGADGQAHVATEELIKRNLVVPTRVDVASEVRKALKDPMYSAIRSNAVNTLVAKAGTMLSTPAGVSAHTRLSQPLREVLAKPVGQITTNKEICLLRDAVADLEEKCKYGAKSPAMQAKKAGKQAKRTPRTVRRVGTGVSGVKSHRAA